MRNNQDKFAKNIDALRAKRYHLGNKSSQDKKFPKLKSYSNILE